MHFITAVLFFSLTPLNEIAKEKNRSMNRRTVEEKERKELFRLDKAKTGEQILQMIDAAEKFNNK